ncbi:hypothetical protein GOBAR_AA07724 [Gossypium barbadense]|uniref:Uncharacterized protein n=1 Tax=Gossypium barbadense TaxID=3634 RepID=A0A2P5YBH5_GOSBA|nr:hypothetical protein GOBAR_AA07724 [Gossypium barbadense]
MGLEAAHGRGRETVAHGCVARLCLSLFTSPTPVYEGPRPCCFGRFTHGHVVRQWRFSVARAGENLCPKNWI